MAVIYEVSLAVRRDLADAYRAWLHGHIQEIVALPGFLGASVHAVLDPPAGADEVALCVQYRLRDRAALDAYLREHAPRLRADGVARFGDGFRAQRRVLGTLADY